VADARKLAGRSLPLLAIALGLVAGAWFVSYGDLRLLSEKPVRLSSFYDAQADSMLRGSFRVPCWAIGTEAFIVQGRCYGYFGITPSLLRMPVNLAWPERRGRWAPLSMLAASALFLAMAWSAARSVRRHLFPDCPDDHAYRGSAALFLLALGLGSTNIFLLSRPVLYHEACIWSVAFALASVVCSYEYWRSGRPAWLWGAAAAGALALHARPVAGAGALIACGLAPILRLPAARRLTGREPLPGAAAARHGLLGAALVALAFGSFFAVSYAKFGVFEPMPVKYNKQYRAKRLARLGGGVLHLSNVGWNLANYFGSAGIAPRFTGGRVGAGTVARMKRAHPRARIDIAEPYMSIPVAMTALLGLAALGTAGCLWGSPLARGLGLLLLCTLLGPVVMLLHAGVSYRYFHEYLLWFGIAGAAGVAQFRQRLAGRPGWKAWLAHSVLALLVAINVALNLEFALLYQINNTNVGARVPAVNERVEEWKRLLGAGR
jgi:hypothetical protein